MMKNKQPQQAGSRWKGITLGILLFVLCSGAGVFVYSKTVAGGQPRHAQPRPHPKGTPGCLVEGMISSQSGPSAVINGGIYSLGDSACGGKITKITSDAVTVKFQDKEQVFSMNTSAELTAVEKTKMKAQKNMEALAKLAKNTLGNKEKAAPAVKENTEQSAPEQTAKKETAQNKSPSVKEKNVEIFITSWCPYCRQLETFLRSKNIKYQRHDIERDVSGKAKYDSLGGGGVPVILIGSKVIRGFNPNEILAELRN